MLVTAKSTQNPEIQKPMECIFSCRQKFRIKSNFDKWGGADLSFVGHHPGLQSMPYIQGQCKVSSHSDISINYNIYQPTIQTTVLIKRGSGYVLAKGSWSEWQEWNACSSTCGNGTRQRTRQCNDTSPSIDGADGVPCNGADSQESVCFVQPCSGENWISRFFLQRL